MKAVRTVAGEIIYVEPITRASRNAEVVVQIVYIDRSKATDKSSYEVGQIKTIPAAALINI